MWALGLEFWPEIHFLPRLCVCKCTCVHTSVHVLSDWNCQAREGLLASSALTSPPLDTGPINLCPLWPFSPGVA